MEKIQLDVTLDKLMEEHKRKRCIHTWVRQAQLHKMTYELVDFKRCRRCGEVQYIS